MKMGPLLLFASLAIGARGCDPWADWRNAPPSASQPPTCATPPSQGNVGGMGGSVGTGVGVGGSDGGSWGVGGGEPTPVPQDICSGGIDDTDSLAGIDPQTLATASLKASALAYYLDGALSSASVDPNDEVAVATFVAQQSAMAEATVDGWLATVDPSTIPTADIIPRYECTEEHQCPLRTQCFNNGAWNNGPPYTCTVVNCGSAKCTSCPDFFPDVLKSLVFDSWCAYACAVRLPPRKMVAVGAVGIKNGKPFPAAGAWCFDP